MYFSNAFGINVSDNEDWFNLLLNSDTAIYIDPMLVYQSDHEDFKSTQNYISSFFREAFRRVAIAKKSKNVKDRRNALIMLNFKEPFEIGFGHSRIGSQGRGIGDDFANQIFNAIVDFIELGFEDFGEYISPLEIFVEGIGPDRISDMMANLMKEDLIKYTHKICQLRNIPTKNFRINNCKFDNSQGWVYGVVKLPENPITKKPIILVPKNFLRTNAYLDREDFLEYVLHTENKIVREQASKLFTQDIDKSELIKVMKSNPDLGKSLFKEYLEMRKSEKAKPYDFLNDPDMLSYVHELIEAMVKKIDNKIEIKDKTIESLDQIVKRIIKEFKIHVESNEGYHLLFDRDGQPKDEKAAQSLFHAISRGFASNANLCLIPEAQTGKGNVDFKFATGYSKKIHVELKLARHKKLVDGVNKQIPAYLGSDDCDLAYYVVIKQLATEQFNIDRLKDACKELKIENKNIILEIVDASVETKTSASKL
jgi:hypothetical protein